MGLLIWFYHTFMFCFTFVTYSSAQFCPPDQKSALLQFKNSLNCTIYSWTTSWKNNTDCCSWRGISCHKSNVIGVDINCCATLPSNSSFFLLTHLQKLNINGNDRDYIPGSYVSPGSGRIPPALGHLTSLTHLTLSSFTGAVPQEISHLSKLVSLDLRGNDLTFDTPTIKRLVRNLTNIKEMLLHVDMSKVAPSAFMNLSSSLTSLDITWCNLGQQYGGEFPVNVMKLPNLQLLSLSHNPMTGRFPNSNWSSPLKSRDVEYTGFSGVIPESIGNLKSLERLNLRGYFTGELPKSIGNLRSLEWLQLTGNNFRGTIPTSLGNLTELTCLVLSHNNFTGELPLSFSKLENLMQLDISYNSFSGQFSDAFTNLSLIRTPEYRFSGQVPSSLFFDRTELYFIDFSHNQLEGPIPSKASVNPYSILAKVSLSDNLLKWSVPSWLFTLPYLLSLDLKMNKLIDSIDQEMISKLKYLDLSYNNIVFSPNTNANFTVPTLTTLKLASCNINEIPYFIKNSNQLTVLDLSNNSIQGHIPEWFWELDSLQFLSLLDLSSNNFTGEIPFSLCNMSYLKILDLSKNTFHGILPNCLGNFSNQITVLKLGQNNFHGKIPTTFANAGDLTNLGLNGNQLEGELPRSLSHCKNLEILDVGNNKMNGTFPYWLETLPSLHVLVLRSNMFHGP